MDEFSQGGPSLLERDNTQSLFQIKYVHLFTSSPDTPGGYSGVGKCSLTPVSIQNLKRGLFVILKNDSSKNPLFKRGLVSQRPKWAIVPLCHDFNAFPQPIQRLLQENRYDTVAVIPQTSLRQNIGKAVPT